MSVFKNGDLVYIKPGATIEDFIVPRGEERLVRYEHVVGTTIQVDNEDYDRYPGHIFCVGPRFDVSNYFLIPIEFVEVVFTK